MAETLTDDERQVIAVLAQLHVEYMKTREMILLRARVKHGISEDRLHHLSFLAIRSLLPDDQVGRFDVAVELSRHIADGGKG
jgi:hypothetical protein